MVLLIFIDGIGLGPLGAHNPFEGAPVEVLAPLAHRPPPKGVHCAFIDAWLGHPGLPQSATGQAVIFTGEDAIEEAGGHWSGTPTPRLVRFIQKHSIFARAKERGIEAAFLNAYDPRRISHLERVMRGDQRPIRRHPPSATSWAALVEGAKMKTFDDVRAGRAATFDFTGEVLRAFGVSAPYVSIPDAARAVVRGAREVKLAAFETFLTDKAGHSQDTTWARTEIVRVDRFLKEILKAIDPTRDLVVITSDHGNLEDVSTRSHTLAPLPLLAHGLEAEKFVEGMATLKDIAPRLLMRASVSPCRIAKTSVLCRICTGGLHESNGFAEDRGHGCGRFGAYRRCDDGL